MSLKCNKILSNIKMLTLPSSKRKCRIRRNFLFFVELWQPYECVYYFLKNNLSLFLYLWNVAKFSFEINDYFLENCFAIKMTMHSRIKVSCSTRTMLYFLIKSGNITVMCLPLGMSKSLNSMLVKWIYNLSFFCVCECDIIKCLIPFNFQIIFY